MGTHRPDHRALTPLEADRPRGIDPPWPMPHQHDGPIPVHSHGGQCRVSRTAWGRRRTHNLAAMDAFSIVFT